MSMTIENGISTTTNLQRACIEVLRAQIQDAKFVDDVNLMLAVKGECAFNDVDLSQALCINSIPLASSYLLNVAFRKAVSMSEGLAYEEYQNSDDQGAGKASTTTVFKLDPLDAKANHVLQHTFPAGPTWTPECLEINGRKGRRAVCVLAEDRLRYRVFDLDSFSSIEGTSANDTDGEDAVME